MISTRSSREARKRSEFRQIFFWQLKKNRLCAVFFTVALLVALPGMEFIWAVSQADRYQNPSAWDAATTAEQLQTAFSQNLAGTFRSQVLLLVIPLTLLFVVAYCISAFGFMHGRRSVDLFHALPLRRAPLFLGSFAAGLVYLYLPLAVAFGLCQGIGWAYGLPAPFSGTMIWQSCLLCALMATAAYTSSLFFCVCSGTLLDAAVSILALNLGWPALCFGVFYTIDITLPGFSASPDASVILAFAPYLAAFLPLRNYFLGVQHVSVGFVVWWVALTLLFLGAALLYYIRRRSECAEDHFSAPLVRGVLRFLISAASGLGLGLIVGEILDSNLAFFIALTLGSFAAHLVSQVLWTHTLRRFWKTIPAYVLVLACQALFLFCLSTGGLGFVSRVPAADQVASATFSPTEVIDNSKESYLAPFVKFQVYDETYEHTYWVSPVLTETTDIQALCRYHAAITDQLEGPFLPFEHEENGYYTTINYTLQDGRNMVRVYRVPLSQDLQDIVDAEIDLIELDGYNQYNLFDQYTADGIDGVSLTLSSEDREFNASLEEGWDNVLTQAQKETVWKTFLEELNSPSFDAGAVYPNWNEEGAGETTSADVNLQPLPAQLPTQREAGEALFVNCEYRISLQPLEVRELSSSMQALIREACGDEVFQSLYYADAQVSLTIPESCPKTRDLIYAYCREMGELYDYTGGQNTEVADTAIG